MHVPIGYLFLSAPPEEPLPIPDFRTMARRGGRRPSPNLLDTLYAAQERQGWYREFALLTRQPEVRFVGSLSTDTPVMAAARTMAEVLGFDLDARAACRTWEEAFRLFIGEADRAGVLVMVSGVVLSNNRRALDPEEFRGFALADARAPVVFINGMDTKAGQMLGVAKHVEPLGRPRQRRRQLVQVDAAHLQGSGHQQGQPFALLLVLKWQPLNKRRRDRRRYRANPTHAEISAESKADSLNHSWIPGRKCPLQQVCSAQQIFDGQ